MKGSSLSAKSGGRGKPKHVGMKALKAGATRHPGTVRVKAMHQGSGIPRGMMESTEVAKRGVIGLVAGRKKKKKTGMMGC